MIPGAAVEQAHPPRSWRPAGQDIARQCGDHRGLACVRAAIEKFLVAHGTTPIGSKLLTKDAADPVAGSPDCGEKQAVAAGSSGSDQRHGAKAVTVFEGPPGVACLSPEAAQLLDGPLTVDMFWTGMGEYDPLEDFTSPGVACWSPEAAQLLDSSLTADLFWTGMVEYDPLENFTFPEQSFDSAERLLSDAFRSEFDVPEKNH